MQVTSWAWTVVRKCSTARKVAGAMLIAVALLFGGLSCGLTVSTPESELKIVEKHFVPTEYSAELWGLAKNVSGRELKSPIIVVQMFNEKGDIVYQWADRINKLGPDETWRFEVRYEKDDATKYKILYRSVLHFG
jgi:hypothetical protein